MRAYELMVIIDADVEDGDVPAVVERIAGQLAAAGATVATTSVWGRRRFAYEIDHKTEGSYVVYELLADGGLDEFERGLRIADDIVRHKLFRLPEFVAERRGLLGEAAAQQGA